MTNDTKTLGPFDQIAEGIVKGQERSGPLRVVFVPAALLIAASGFFPSGSDNPALTALSVVTQFAQALALVAGAAILARKTGLGRLTGYDALMTELSEPSILLGAGALWAFSSILDSGDSLLWFLIALPLRLIAIALIFLAPAERLGLLPAIQRSAQLLVKKPLRFTFTLVAAAAAAATVLGFGLVVTGLPLRMCGVPTEFLYAGLLFLLWPYVIGALSACVWSVRD